MPGINYEFLVGNGSLALIFLLMLANGIFSFPSSQILYITAGIFVGTGKLSLIPVVIVGALGNAIGNSILYEITRKKGEKVASKLLPLTKEHYAALKKSLEHKGLFFIFIGKLTPSLKVLVPVVAGLGKTNRVATHLIFLAASALWSLCFVLIGMYFGKSFSFGTYGIVIGGIGLLVALYFMRLVQKNTGVTDASEK